MNASPIEPGSVLGVLGAGQLGAMFATAAVRLGYRVAVWDPDADAPAHQLADHSFARPFADQEAAEEFARLASVVTYEWENVPVQLCEQLERARPLRPSSAVLRIIQNRLVQKIFLAEQGFPVPRFKRLPSPDQLDVIIDQLGPPVICKTATAGYDGKGQWRIEPDADRSAIAGALHRSSLPGMEWIVESVVPFERELSILVARGLNGRSVTYPLVENIHEEGILRTTVVPAIVSPSVARQAELLAQSVVERMEGVGVFCLELFETPGGDLLINEVAPRPHNSGHYTLDACTVSQFEQQARAICGMPLGEARLVSPAVMVNLIGMDAETININPDCRELLSLPDTHLHRYGKRVIRPRRKMGHVTFLANTREVAYDRAIRFRNSLLRQASY